MFKTVLRLLSLVLILGTAGWWVQAGRNAGWTKNKVAVVKKDEITEIEYTEYENRFVPGVDVLAAGGAAGLVLLGASFLGRRKSGGHPG